MPVHERLWRPAGASEDGGLGWCVLRPCSSLLYPNAEAIHDEALRLALARGMPVVLDLSVSPFLAADGAEAIRDLAAACAAAGIPLVLAEAASSVLEKLTAAGVAVRGLPQRRREMEAGAAGQTRRALKPSRISCLPQCVLWNYFTLIPSPTGTAGSNF